MEGALQLLFRKDALEVLKPHPAPTPKALLLTEESFRYRLWADLRTEIHAAFARAHLKMRAGWDPKEFDRVPRPSDLSDEPQLGAYLRMMAQLDLLHPEISSAEVAEGRELANGHYHYVQLRQQNTARQLRTDTGTGCMQLRP